MKKVLTLLVLLCIAQSAQAYQVQQWQMQQHETRTKCYSSSGSLLGYAEPQKNGTTKYYNRYHQFNSYSKADGGNRVKYYSK